MVLFFDFVYQTCILNISGLKVCKDGGDPSLFTTTGTPANVNNALWAATRALNTRRITSWRYFGLCLATYKHLAANSEKGIWTIVL